MAFLDEVRQQPESLRNLVRFYRSEEGAALLDQARSLTGVSPRSYLFTGMGSSEYVAISVRDTLAAKCGVPVVVRDAGELLHYGLRTVSWHDAVVAVSQSGESIETRKVVEALQGHPRLMALTNSEASTMARLARLNLPLLAGDETAISTKTYTNSLGLLAILDAALTRTGLSETLGQIEATAGYWETWLSERSGEADMAAEFLKDADSLDFVARGPSMAAALQAALTFREGAHLHTAAMSGGGFRHGPMEMAGPGTCLVVFAPCDHGGDLLRKMAREAAEFGSPVVLLTGQVQPRHRSLLQIEISAQLPHLFGLACAVAQEMLLERMARGRGLTAGVFLRGGKVTARE